MAETRWIRIDAHQAERLASITEHEVETSVWHALVEVLDAWENGPRPVGAVNASLPDPPSGWELPRPPATDEPLGTCVIHGDYWTDDCMRCGR